jgi:hypothetical protein
MEQGPDLPPSVLLSLIFAIIVWLFLIIKNDRPHERIRIKYLLVGGNNTCYALLSSFEQFVKNNNTVKLEDVLLFKTDIEDLAEWATAIAANDARVVKGLLGSLSDPSNTTKRIGSCDPETLLGRVWTLNFQDYNFTETGNPLVFEKEAFYNDVQADPSKYYLVYGSCDGRSWLVPNFTLMMNVNVPDNNQDARFMNVQVMYQGLTMGTQYVLDLGLV